MDQATANIARWPWLAPADTPPVPLRIAHLLPNLAVGGRERLANMLCDTGRDHDLSSMLIGYEPLPNEAAALAPAVPFIQLDRTAPGFIPRLRGVLAERGIDVVHAQGHVPAVYLARALRTESRIASLASVHEGLHDTWRWICPIRRGLRAMDHLVAVSRPIAKAYGRLSGRALSVIPNGIDPRPFADMPLPAPGDDEPFRFAMVARLDRVKRHADAVLAADRLVGEGRRIELHIAGEGPEAATLLKMAGSRPWLNLAGPIDDVAAFLRDKNAFLLPSRSEGMPLALAEAMAAGRPSIISDLPSLRDMAEDAALYISPGAIDQLAGAMAHLMTDASLRRTLSTMSRLRAAAFDFRATSEAYAELYRKLSR